jgi:broad specificity phosphatase PhoE
MKKIILMRHPETEENLIEIQQSLKSCTFTKEGNIELEKTKNYLLETFKIDLIYSSDSPRCINSAKKINESLNETIVVTKKLRDKSNGIFEGKKNSEIDWTEINKMPFGDKKAPEGENLKEVKFRLIKIIEEIKKMDANTTLIITHSVPFRVLTGILLNYTLEESIFNLKSYNCGLTLIELNEVGNNPIFFNKQL